MVLKARLWSYAAVYLCEKGRGRLVRRRGRGATQLSLMWGRFIYVGLCHPELHGLLCVLCVVFLLEAIVGLVTLNKLFG